MLQHYCTSALASTSNGSVCLPKRLLRSIPDAGIDWHGSNQCVIFLVNYEMFLRTGLFQSFVLVVLTPMEVQAAKWLALTILHPQIGTCTLNSHYWASVRKKNHTSVFMLQTKSMKSPFQATEAAFVLLANLCRKRWELVRKSPQCSCDSLSWRRAVWHSCTKHFLCQCILSRLE